ncbi:MAG TPA: hypothetical protein VEN81_03645, partial [Planctomycetota bacterium]|nr:hypothetical protein [Planctomycetota bacterium]
MDEQNLARQDTVYPLPFKEFQWQFVARTIVAGFLAIVACVAYERKFLESSYALWALLGVCAAIVAYNSILLFAGRLKIPTARLTLIALILDLFALTSYLHYSGDIENPLMFAYSLPVVAAAVLVSRRAAFFLAGGSAILFILLMMFTTLDKSPIILHHYHLGLLGKLDVTKYVDPDDNPQGWNYILAYLLVLMSVLFGSAHGFGTLSERVREKERALAVENERLLLLLGILPE